MNITFEHIVAGVECTVHASHFTSDESVGIYFGPAEMWAKSLGTGEDVEIPDAELDDLVELSIDAYYSAFEDVGLREC